MDALVYAPHFRRLPAIERRASQFDDDELTVVPARELFTGTWRNRRHVLALGLSEPIPDFLPLETTLAECDRQGASVLVPHPTFMTVSLTAAELRTHLDQIAAIEAYNPKFLPHHTRRASTLGAELDVPLFGSSYAHLRGTVGEVWTEFAVPIETSQSLQEAIENGQMRAVRRRGGAGHIGRRIAEFTHLIWENSWDKFDRVVLSGQEDTHPRHPAYDGRFADAAVY